MKPFRGFLINIDQILFFDRKSRNGKIPQNLTYIRCILEIKEGEIMKKVFYFAVCLVLMLSFVFLCSCDSNDTNSGSKDSTIGEVIRSKTSAVTVPKNSTAVTDISEQEVPDNERIYISEGYECVYRKNSVSTTYNDLLTLGSMDSIWYPGAVLQLSYAADTDAKIKTVNLPRAPMDLSINLETASGINPDALAMHIENPSLSTVRKAISDSLNSTVNNENVNIPTALSCDIIEINNSQSLNLALGIDVNICSFNFSFDLDFSEKNERHYAALVFKQIYFTIDMDHITDDPKAAFKDTVTAEDVQSAFDDGCLPVYCSVVYGRLAIVMIDTKMEFTELKSSLNIGYAGNGLSVDLEAVAENTDTSMSYFIYGGSSEETGAITSTNISEFVERMTQTSFSSAKPLGYRFYRMADGNIAKIGLFTEYITSEIVPVRVASASLEYFDKNHEKIRNEVYPGTTIYPELSINPLDAIHYTAEYSLENEIDSNGKIMASYTRGGIVKISKDAEVGSTIRIKVKITQIFEGNEVSLYRYYDVRIKEIPVEEIEIYSSLDTLEVDACAELDLNARIYPSNATNQELKWYVQTGSASFIPGTKHLKINAGATDGEQVIVFAVGANEVISNKLTLTVKKETVMEINSVLLNLDYTYIVPGKTYPLFASVDPYVEGENDKIKYVLFSSSSSVYIKDNCLYVLENAEIGDRIYLSARYGNISSDITALKIAPTVNIIDEGVRLDIELDNGTNSYQTMIVSIKDDSNKEIFLESTSSNLVKLADKLGNYTGNLNIAVKVIMSDDSILAYTLKHHSLYASGAGTETTPYLIKNQRHLANMQYNPDKYFKIAEDISIDGSKTWYPLESFTGVLDGANHSINFGGEANMLYAQIDDENKLFHGLLTKSNSGVISNLTIQNAWYHSYSFRDRDENYHGDTYTIFMGGIAGKNEASGSIVQCHIINSDFKCDRNNSAFGCVVGINTGIISDCSAQATIYVTGDGGGIAGRNENKLKSCTFSGTMGIYLANDNGGQSIRSWGGIVGYSNNGSIDNCYVEKFVFNYHGDNSIYHREIIFHIHKNCNMQIKVGVICGHNQNPSKVTNCNYNEGIQLKVQLCGGDFHYGDHEKKYLFAYDNGKIGKNN